MPRTGRSGASLRWAWLLIALCAALLGPAGRAQPAPEGAEALARLARLQGEWQAATPDFRSTLAYAPGPNWVRATNRLTAPDGRPIAHYEGIYFWDPARVSLRFVTVGDDGALHEGTADWRDDGLWHDAAISGPRPSTYRSLVSPAGDRLEYRAIYGRMAPHDEVRTGAPLIYRRAGPER